MEELNELLNIKKENMRVINSGWYGPKTGKDAKEEHDKQHIPTAVFFNVNQVRDTDNPCPNMLPKLDNFIYKMKEMQIRKDDLLVVYDQKGIMFSARTWYLIYIYIYIYILGLC